MLVIWAMNVLYRQLSNRPCGAGPARSYYASVRTRRMYEHVTVSRLFLQERSIIPLRKGPPRTGGAVAWREIVRIAFRRVPLELVHWGKSLRAVRRMDILIVAGTGIVADYMTGPLGWPYDIFKFSTLAALCRVKLVFLSVGVGPIHHPLSRWFLKRGLALADHRSYRDEASRQYLERIGFGTDRDLVCPDVVFGLSPSNLFSGVRPGQRRVVGLGLKDYGTSERLEPTAFQKYLDTMAAFVSWLQERGYSVRLLIGDFQYR